MKNLLMVMLIVLLSVSVVNAGEILIGGGILNGDFELPATGKPLIDSGKIPDWTVWTEVSGASDDTGIDDGGAIDSRIMFIQPTGAVKDMTTETIDADEEFTYSIESVLNERGDITIGLIYDNAGVFTLIEGTQIVLVAPTVAGERTTASGVFTAIAGQDYIGKAIGIGLYDAGNWPEVDNAFLEGGSLVRNVWAINPLNGEDNVAIDETLSWGQMDPNLYIDLYWGPENEPNLLTVAEYKRLTDQKQTTYDPGAMENDKTYYWRVDTREPNLVSPYEDVITAGPVWSYTTIGIEPEAMEISPAVGQAVEAGSNAVFTASGINVTYWTWYKEGVATPLSNGTEYSGVDTSELTILGVDIDDEGLYYCVGSNDETPGITDQTDPAQLLLTRVIGSWKLDYNLDDSVTDLWPTATGYPGSMIDPNYVAGIADGAIDILSDRYIQMGGTDEVYNFYPMGMTVSAWIKTAQAGWGAIVSKSDRGGEIVPGEIDPQVGWVLEHEDDTVYLTFRGGSSIGFDGGVTDDEWHLVVGTYDAGTGITSIYVSYVDEYGVSRIGEAHSSENRNFTFTDLQPLKVGNETNLDESDTNAFAGLIDDVRVYSYAMDITEIAQDLYLPIKGGSVCADPNYDEVFDLTHDCQTNLDDLAELAANWLADGLL